jgi:hypothetical protein
LQHPGASRQSDGVAKVERKIQIIPRSKSVFKN